MQSLNGTLFSITAAKLVTACVYGGYRSSQPAALPDSCLVCNPFPGRPSGSQHFYAGFALRPTAQQAQRSRPGLSLTLLVALILKLGTLNTTGPRADGRAPALMSVRRGLGMGNRPLVGSAEQHCMGNTGPGNLSRKG